MTRFALVLLMCVVVHSAFSAPATKPIRNVQPIDGNEQSTFQNIPDPLTYGPHRDALDELVGTAYVAGTTWYDYQHNGTTGKMIDVDDLGFVHITCMNELNSTCTYRHVYY